MPVTRPQARNDLAVVELDGEVVIYDETSGDLHYLNPTATIVFSLCDGTATIRELSTDIAETFGAPLDEVERQVRGLVRQMRRGGLLEPVRPNGKGTASANGRKKKPARRARG